MTPDKNKEKQQLDYEQFNSNEEFNKLVNVGGDANNRDVKYQIHTMPALNNKVQELQDEIIADHEKYRKALILLKKHVDKRLSELESNIESNKTESDTNIECINNKIKNRPKTDVEEIKNAIFSAIGNRVLKSMNLAIGAACMWGLGWAFNKYVFGKH